MGEIHDIWTSNERLGFIKYMSMIPKNHAHDKDVKKVYGMA